MAPIEPEKTVVYGVKWVEGSFKDGKWDPTSKIIFPNSFNGEVETDVKYNGSIKYELNKMLYRLLQLKLWVTMEVSSLKVHCKEMKKIME